MYLILLKLLTGFILGYIISSIVEAFVHKYVLHASASSLRLWRKYPKIFWPLTQEHYIHAIHHGRTFKEDYVTQFRDESEQNKLDSELYSTNPNKLVDHIKKTEYGLFAQPRGAFYMGIITTVVFAIPIYFLFGFWVLIGTIFPFYFLAYIMSRYVHPFSHQDFETAIQDAPYLLRKLLRTKYLQMVIRHHFIHHEYPLHNFNLILGADYFLGWHKKPKEEDREKMRNIGIKI